MARIYWTYNELSTDLKGDKSNPVLKHYYLISKSLKLYQSFQWFDYNLLQTNLVEVYGFTQKIIGKRVWIENSKELSIACLDNGMLTFIGGFRNQVEIEKCADSMSQFSNFLKERDIPLFFALFPFKVHSDDSQLPVSAQEFFNDNANRFLIALKKREVQFVDTRLLYKDNSPKHYRQFYKGDHHWKPEYAYHAYLYISKQLQECKCNLATFFSDTGMEVENYSVVRKYPPFYKVRGSQERRIGRWYLSDVDWAYYWIPKSKTDYSFTVPFPEGNIKPTEVSGSLEDTFLYYYYDMPMEIVVNNQTKSTNKILVIQDSFIHPFLPFLAKNNKEVHLIDVRHYQGKVVDYVNKIQPDAVIVAYSAGSIYDDMFRFFEEKEE